MLSCPLHKSGLNCYVGASFTETIVVVLGEVVLVDNLVSTMAHCSLLLPCHALSMYSLRTLVINWPMATGIITQQDLELLKKFIHIFRTFCFSSIIKVIFLLSDNNPAPIVSLLLPAVPKPCSSV